MSIVNGTEVFILGAGHTINLMAIFNSNSFTKGGDYMGPLVVAGVSIFQFHRVLTPSTVGLEFTSPKDDLQTFCIYHYSIKNSSTHSAAFRVDFFFD
jgi:hypothetical protein